MGADGEDDDRTSDDRGGMESDCRTDRLPGESRRDAPATVRTTAADPRNPLGPVDMARAVQTRLAQINDTRNPGARVPVPAGHGEIALLAQTINATLTHLDHADDQATAVLDRLGRFAADASHELRTPVAALRVELEESRLHPELMDPSELLDRALKGVERLQTIISDLLLLARPDLVALPMPQHVDLTELILDEMSRHPRHQKIQLSVETDEGIMVNADHLQIRGMLAILLDNACRHAEGTVLVRIRLQGGVAELSVSEDGQGGAEADRQRNFEPFSRLDGTRCHSHDGSGLSLAIAREIAHGCQGSLWVDEAPEREARFVARIPVTRAVPAPALGL
ncbi:sensor histidine kinase [Planotetraspora kaengkrachanensis]|uniref:histidine kinase n=1 Tax=Planotetraspora kaengkrachanensis TaxID=575193 RepID=A0A8J3M4X0_9ACTN|nr:HAMP domain-containing sensor histidine kinase [Planotetraspora kaengkrachanensis]GIG79524.1 hypothetical protein Pka01_26510 [Planotetraspora kaengkrachanensis]